MNRCAVKLRSRSPRSAGPVNKTACSWFIAWVRALIALRLANRSVRIASHSSVAGLRRT